MQAPNLGVQDLKDKIEEEANRLSTKVDEYQKRGLEKVESLFDRKFLAAAGGVVGCGSIMFGAVIFLKNQGLTGQTLGVITVIAGLGIWWLTNFLSRRKTPDKPI